MKVVAVDQGTTSTRGFTLDAAGRFAFVAAREHRQIYPRPGWVEHDPEEILANVRAVIAAAGPVDAIGLDNQGETVVAWDGADGRPLANAIVWQDDRTKDATARLKAAGAEALTLARAGLPLDPYFSASKLRWFLDHLPAARDLLRRGRLRLGTSDAFLLARLTGNFVTDLATASRTSLLSLATLQWDPELCALFGVPPECLPAIRPTAGDFGDCDGTPVTAGSVDQQAALFGHGCARPGDAKITFGTGAFALAVTGPSRLDGGGILPTVAWQLGRAPADLALEGGVYNAASAVNWARGLGLFRDFAEIDGFAAPPAIGRDLAFVPALSGLACPHWDRGAAGLWIGLGLDTTKADLMQSLLEGVALRAAEVVGALAARVQLADSISVDGGMARNPYFLRVLAEVLQRRVVVPSSTDLTALGIARLALLGAGWRELPPLPPAARTVEPAEGWGAAARARFAQAVDRAKGWR
jgi:glycerol kinase